MSVNISGITNKDEYGKYSWEKTVTDVNNIDENFANARDLGYTRLNYARVTAVASIDKFNSVDTYKIQVQSNGNLSVSLRNTDSTDENVLDLSEYEEYLDQLKKQLDPEGWQAEQDKKTEELKNQNVLDPLAPGMSLKIYSSKNGKPVLIADSTAERDSKEYETLKAIVTGEYRATKGDFYIEVGTTNEIEDKNESHPYALQVLQGKDFKHDYVMKQMLSEDSKKKKISDKPSESATSTTGISAAYAAQIQAQKYSVTATMLSNGYLNFAQMTAGKTDPSKVIFSTLL
ncbi:MAG: hypothetical protein E7010_02210 [Alphaproteobacteria bacterium]|nr:hypothetical protein [Alphaproteobacteria bacterium]